jgi:two-component system, NtrC family, nitrogen regulation sensor histidine kinase NtrY
MIYKNFRIIIFVHIFLIVGLTLLLSFVISEAETLFAPVVIGGLLLFLVINLIRYIEKSNRDFTHFLLSLRQGAFTESYTSGNRGKGFKELSNAMNEIAREFANLNTEKELHYQYLQALNENINVAILSFDGDGKLIMMNTAAKRLLNLPSFSNLEHFKRIDSNLYDTVNRIEPDERAIVKAFIGEESYQLSVQAKEIILQGKPVRIFLLQNLNSELDAKEIEAWYQLIRVLTHEIMNSVTPILSLTAAMQNILNNADGSPKELSKLTSENKEDVFSSVSTIESRSKGLLKFVNAYKEYARPIELRLEETDALIIANRVADLFKQDLHEKNIDLRIESKVDSAKLTADVALVEQVLINLVKNGLEALPNENGKIQITISSNLKNGIRISIADNGAGVDPETMSKIFIPFFTTKPKGTGIGLSLSRQIMKLHGGSIQIQSTPGKGSKFTLEFL